MSVPVDLDELQQRLDEYGANPFLVTVSAGGGAHVVSVSVGFDGERFSVAAGRTSLANIDASGRATLLWPGPTGPYALIVDGDARHDGETAVVRPTRAVLHRLAGASPDLPSCVAIERPE